VIAYPLAAGTVLTRVLEAGAGDDHLVLLHGAGSRADRWQHNIEPLARAGFHVYAVDFPGHGFAAKGPEVECSVPAYSMFLTDLLQTLGIASAVLVGTSLGGHAAAHAALRQPGIARALVLVGATGLFPNGPERRARTAGRLRDTTRDGIAEKLRALVHDDSLVSDEWIREEFRINNSPGSAASFDTLAQYFNDRLDEDCLGDAVGGLAERLPTLLVWGVEDVMVPVETGREARLMMPTASLVEIEHAGHAPYYERPDVFNEALLAFLQGVPAQVNSRRAMP
jgi:pimeloyl-ACP methyl ester carboxylesterase